MDDVRRHDHDDNLSGSNSDDVAAATQRWFECNALALLDARNRKEVDCFTDLIEAHQQLLFRAAANTMSMSMSMSSSSTNNLGMSTNLSSMHLGNSTSSPAANDLQAQIDAVARKYLATIQHLEHEVSEKNAQLAHYAGNQLQLMSESKELLQAQEHWSQQLTRITAQLEDEMVTSDAKDRVITELNAALQLAHNELQRYRTLLERAEHDNAALRTQISTLDAQVAANASSTSATATQSQSTATSQAAADSESVLYGDRVRTSSTLTHVVHSLRAHATEVNSVSFNTSGKILFSGSSDGTVRAWDATTARALGEYRGVGTAHPLLCVRGSDDGALVLGTGCDRKCFVWRVATGRIHQTLVGHKGKVLAAEFAAGSNELITGSSDRSMRVWDIARGRSLQTINCHSSCNDVAIAPGELIASAHQDGAVRFWDARTKKAVHELTGLHSEQCTSVSFAASGAQLLTNSRDHCLHVIDPRTFGITQTLQHRAYQCGFDWAKASLSHDGAFAAAGSANGTLFVWNAATGAIVNELKGGHHGAVACCVWRPSGNGVASCDKNGLLVLWE